MDIKQSGRIISCFLFLFLGLFNQGNGQQLSLIDSLELALELTPDEAKRIGILNTLSGELVTRDPDEAGNYASEAYDLAIKLEDENGLMKALVNAGFVEWSKGNYKEAMEKAIRAEEIAEKADNGKALAHALHLTGLIYTDLGNFQKSTEYFFQSLAIYKEVDDNQGVSRTLNTIGVIQFEQKNYTGALEYFFNSLNLAREIGYNDGIARGLNNVAIVFESRQEYDKAGHYFNEAVRYNKELGHLKGEGINYLNLGITHGAMDKYDSALYFYNKALTIFNDLEINLLIAKTKNYIGEFYLGQNQYDSCRIYALSALEEGRDINSKVILHSSARLLHKLSLNQGDTSSAYHWAMLQNRMQDSLNIEESKTELSKLELLHKISQREKEQKIERQRKDFLALTLIIVLVFSLIVILLIYARQISRSRASQIERQHLKDSLEFRSKELAANVLFLMRKNEILSNISNQLLEIEKEAVRDETRNALQRIAREVKRSKETDVWTEFEMRFSQVYDDYYKNLSEQYPELTSNDLRLCAFLKLNLTSKEISNITGQRIGTIEMARSRLRKKFGISKTHIDIVTFLSKF